MLIGGVPAKNEIHGLPYKSDLFDKSAEFTLVLLTEEQYTANKENLITQKHSPFTRVYVFYKKNGENSDVYHISSGLGGNNSLLVINSSRTINVELRLDGVIGPTIGFAPAGILETTLKLNDGNYVIFPVFKRYNLLRDVVETVFPRGADYYWYQSYSFGGGVTHLTMNLKDLLEKTSFITGAAWINIENISESAGIQFLTGAIVNNTATGQNYIMNGAPTTFQIDMPGNGNSYLTSRQVSNWKFGPPGGEVGLQVSEHDDTPLNTLTIYANKMYTVTVAGDHNAITMKAWISGESDIPLGELAGEW